MADSKHNELPVVYVVDDVPEIRQMMGLLVESVTPAKVYAFDNGAAALEHFLAEPGVDLVISDFDMPLMTGAELFQQLRKRSPVPFLLHSSDSVEDHPEFSAARDFFAIDKLADSADIVAKVQELLAKALARKTIPLEDYLPVPLTLFERLGEVNVPLYLKMPGGRYLKVAHAESAFRSGDGQRFQEKGQHELFVSRAEFMKFLDFMKQKLAEPMGLAKGKVPRADDGGVSIAAASLEFLREAQEQLGLSPEVRDLTIKNVALVVDVAASNPEIEPWMRVWKATGNQFADRCTLIAMLSTSIAKKLKWVNVNTADKLAYAAVLHDLSLSHEDLARQDELEEQVLKRSGLPKPGANDPLFTFFQHPRRAAEVLQQWPQCPVDSQQIVLQHHERPDGKGFPQGLQAQWISPLAAVFIISYDMARFVIAHQGRKPLSEWLTLRADFYSKGEFKRVITVLAQP